MLKVVLTKGRSKGYFWSDGNGGPMHARSMARGILFRLEIA